jgi:Phosphotransferase enzyme family
MAIGAAWNGGVILFDGTRRKFPITASLAYGSDIDPAHQPDMLDFDETHLDYHSDEELMDFIESTGTPLGAPPCPVRQISPNLVAKVARSETLPDALAAQCLVRELGIRVPEIRRTITKNNQSYIIMDRVPGETLETCWSRLGWIATIQLAFELRNFVRRMRQVSSSTAGGLETGVSTSLWLEDYYGLPLHASPSDIQSYITFWLQYPQRRPQVYPDPELHRENTALVPSIPTKFVFTHQDLAPRNILIDKHQRMWLIDWDLAGFYPLYFEYAGMQNFDHGTWNSIDRLRWWIFSWISVGVYSRELKALGKVREYSVSNAFGRSRVPGIQRHRHTGN